MGGVEGGKPKPQTSYQFGEGGGRGDPHSPSPNPKQVWGLGRWWCGGVRGGGGENCFPNPNSLLFKIFFHFFKNFIFCNLFSS